MKAVGGCDLKFVVTPSTDSGNALRFKKTKKQKKLLCVCFFFFNGLLRDVILIFTFCFGVFWGVVFCVAFALLMVHVGRAMNFPVDQRY